MENISDSIYIYLWDTLNTVYIGRTVRPKVRHYQHRTRKDERTYKFTVEHNIEHPSMIILESGLTIEEGVEREKYWIEYYRNETSYNVLNKSYGGQIGGQLCPLTEEEKKNRKKEYRKRFNDSHREKINLERKLYYEKNRDKIKEKSKLYYEKNKEKIKKYYEDTKDKRKEYMKEYWEKHREEKKEVDRKRYEEHKTEKLAYLKEYRETHREKVLELKRRYRERHREELKEKAKEYRRKKAGKSL